MATKACLVTVGSTKFEALTDFLDENGRDFLGELKKRGMLGLGRYTFYFFLALRGWNMPCSGPGGLGE
eukprot:787224-Amorphochlora_amoeboformis.AAC.1